MKAYILDKKTKICTQMLNHDPWKEFTEITEPDEKELYKDKNLFISETPDNFFIGHRNLCSINTFVGIHFYGSTTTKDRDYYLEVLRDETEVLRKKKIQVVLSDNEILIAYGRTK